MTNPNEFTIEHAPMICGSREAEIRTYRRVDGQAGRVWLVAIQENAGDNVYVWYGEGVASEGFAGRTISFRMEDGSTLALKAPWASNTDSLLQDTGVDLRATHLTFGVIARERRMDERYRTVLSDIVYQDPAPVVGLFDRIQTLAQALADRQGEKLVYFSKSQGGSSCGWVYPKRAEVAA